MVHTQNIEWLWRNLKEWGKNPGIRSSFLYEYLARYLFIKAHEYQHIHHFFFTPHDSILVGAVSSVSLPLFPSTKSLQTTTWDQSEVRIMNKPWEIYKNVTRK